MRFLPAKGWQKPQKKVLPRRRLRSKAAGRQNPVFNQVEGWARVISMQNRAA
jgi:hypothetical protein